MKKEAINTKTHHSRHNYCYQCPISQQCLPQRVQNLSVIDKSLLQWESIILKKGEYLSRQATDNEALYAIQVGCLKSVYTKVDGSEYIINFYMPSHIFGWESLDTSRHAPSLIAITDCNICYLPRNKLNQVIKEAPEIAQQLLSISARQIRHNNVNMLRTTATQRIASFILQLKPYYQINTRQRFTLSFSMTQADIANYLRLSAETLSRQLKKLDEDNIITLKHREIELIDLTELKNLAEFTDNYGEQLT